MIFLVLLRRLSPRAQLITGLVLVAVGLAVVALSAVLSGLLIHGIALAVIGVALCLRAAASRRRARRVASESTVANEPTSAGSGRGR